MDIEGLQKDQIVRLEKEVSALFHLTCNDLKESPFRSISSNVPLVSDPAYDMDIASLLELLEILDPLSFPSRGSSVRIRLPPQTKGRQTQVWCLFFV